MSILLQSSRKKKSTTGCLLRIVLVVFLMSVISCFAAAFFLKNYLRSEKFQATVNEETSKVLHAESEIKGLKWRGLNANISKYLAKGKAGAFFETLDIEGVRMRFNFSAIRRGIWEISNLTIGSLKVNIDQTQEKTPLQKEEGKGVAKQAQKEEVEKTDPWYQKWIPNKFRLNLAKVRTMTGRFLTKDAGVFYMKDLTLEAKGNTTGDRWNIHLGKGKVTWSEFPERQIYPDAIEGLLSKDAVFINTAKIRIDNGAKLNGEGEWSFLKEGPRRLDFHLEGYPIEHLVQEDWKKRLLGKLEGKGILRLDSQEKMRLNARIFGHETVLQAFPVLDKIAKFTRIERFRRLTFDTMQADLEYRDKEMHLLNLLIEDYDFVKLAGSLHFTELSLEKTKQKLRGNLRLGLAEEVFERLPATLLPLVSLFKKEGNDGYRWTPIEVFGTPSKPKYDVIENLKNLYGLKFFTQMGSDVFMKSAEGLLKGAQKIVDPREKNSLLDIGEQLLNKGIEVLEDNTEN